jgi:2-(1,2-epoxy-1,2-dihydrophenyl)acetyl-CoA isomerase
VSKVTPAGTVLAATQEQAAKLARGPRSTTGLMKRLFNLAHEASLERMMEVEATYQDVISEHPDHIEGKAAFLEKRPAKFL